MHGSSRRRALVKTNVVIMFQMEEGKGDKKRKVLNNRWTIHYHDTIGKDELRTLFFTLKFTILEKHGKCGAFYPVTVFQLILEDDSIYQMQTVHYRQDN